MRLRAPAVELPSLRGARTRAVPVPCGSGATCALPTDDDNGGIGEPFGGLFRYACGMLRFHAEWNQGLLLTLVRM